MKVNFLSRSNHLEVSYNGGIPKSSTLVGFSTIDHPFWGILIERNPHLYEDGWIKKPQDVRMVGLPESLHGLVVASSSSLIIGDACLDSP